MLAHKVRRLRIQFEKHMKLKKKVIKILTNFPRRSQRQRRNSCVHQPTDVT
jgi:hypothetical protein